MHTFRPYRNCANSVRSLVGSYPLNLKRGSECIRKLASFRSIPSFRFCIWLAPLLVQNWRITRVVLNVTIPRSWISIRLAQRPSIHESLKEVIEVNVIPILKLKQARSKLWLRNQARQLNKVSYSSPVKYCEMLTSIPQMLWFFMRCLDVVSRSTQDPWSSKKADESGWKRSRH